MKTYVVMAIGLVGLVIGFVAESQLLVIGGGMTALLAALYLDAKR